MDCPVHNPWQPYRPDAEPSAEAVEEQVLEAVDDVVEWADANRATPEQVREVANRKPPVRYSKKSRRKKKPLGEHTLNEVFIDGPRRIAKRVKSSRRSR